METDSVSFIKAEIWEIFLLLLFIAWKYSWQIVGIQ